jgi:hypothetical protein
MYNDQSKPRDQHIQHTILSLSFNAATSQRRAEALKQNGFRVVSVNSPTQARYEIEMGQCGIFITCPLVADIVSLDLLALFRKFCPTGTTIAVTSARTHAAIGPHVDIEVEEADDPGGIVQSLLARLRGARGAA